VHDTLDPSQRGTWRFDADELGDWILGGEQPEAGAEERRIGHQNGGGPRA
jgi:hypothetical protein